MVEFSFDRDEFRPDPEDRRREAERRQEREREMDRAFFERQQREQFERDLRRDAQEEAIRRMVNDPDIFVDDTLANVINDPSLKMDKDMTVRRVKTDSQRPMTGRQRIRSSGQFSNLVLGVDLTDRKPKKRARKKTKTDKNMSKALAEANQRYRKKNGMLRKGKTQADIMRLAHRLRKKMS